MALHNKLNHREGHHDPSAQKDPREDSLMSSISRRSLLKLMGASALAASGFAGCERKPPRKVVSQAIMPEYMKPGKAILYASTWTEGPFPYGMMVKTVDGRPVKIDGNPDHPINKGSSTAAMQAALLSLYDPERLDSPRKGGKSITWAQVDQEIVNALRQAKRVAIITRSNLGPSETALIRQLQGYGPQVWHFVHERIHNSHQRNAWHAMFGEDGNLVPVYSQAKTILSIGCDFLGSDETSLEASRQFAGSRQVERPQSEMSRLYVAEAAFSTTGANADHRIRLKPSALAEFANALLADLQVPGGASRNMEALAQKYKLDGPTLNSLVRDLTSQQERALVVAGRELPAQVHATVALINQFLDAYGKTILWHPASTLPVTDTAEAEAVLTAGVDVLICLRVNPVFDWPGQDFQSLIRKAKVSIAHGLLPDETLSTCTYALPSTHNLESWNDTAPRTGIWSLCQPVIEPLVNARQEAESLLAWTRGLAPGANWAGIADWHDYIRTRWQKEVYPQSGSAAAFDEFWEGALRAGVTTRPTDPVSPKLNSNEAQALQKSALPATTGLELVLRPHHGIWDGRFANCDWLQELPDPITKIVWDNPALLNPATARELGIQTGDIVDIQVGNRKSAFPVYVQAGLADGTIVATLGSGSKFEGHLRKVDGKKKESGFAAAGLIAPGGGLTPFLAYGAKVQETGRKYKFAQTQLEPTMKGRPIVLQGTLGQFKKDPRFIQHLRHLPEQVDIHHDYVYLKHRWAMVIDLNKCQACGSCAVACQAENNVPAVGKKECGRGRNMHWLRADRYFYGDAEDPGVVHQIMLCQHCEKAPCENVCPVAATTHSPEGINEMTYNRCVGTRYCSNNCPYKIRHFNFYNYPLRFTGKTRLNLMYNPQVTVRTVGIMEKCTYCIQRINAAKYHAAIRDAKIPDGEVQTACQQACPSGAIVFGDLNDPASEVSKLFKSERTYHVLAELNTETRTVYMAKIQNPAPGTAAEKKIIGLQNELKKHSEENI